MTATDELRQCPCCGGAGELKRTSTWDYYVKCTECGLRTRNHHDNDVGAVARWNERAEVDSLRELVLELSEFVSRAEWLQEPELRDRMRELGIEVAE